MLQHDIAKIKTKKDEYGQILLSTDIMLNWPIPNM